MTKEHLTVAERLKSQFDNLTRAERQLAACILENYPASGLGTITTLGKRADVSTPTVARMVQKLDFSGFPDFQAALRMEIEAKISAILDSETRAGGEVFLKVRWTPYELNRAQYDKVLEQNGEDFFINDWNSFHSLSSSQEGKRIFFVADSWKRLRDLYADAEYCNYNAQVRHQARSQGSSSSQ